MKALIRGLLALSIVFAVAAVVSAHEPPGVEYFAVKFPDGVTPGIDGDLEDWDMIPDTYWITHENDDIQEARRGTAKDLADINIKCIVGWNESTNRVYTMAWVADDYLHNSRENPGRFNLDDDINFVIDADHSGGALWAPDMGGLEDDERLAVEYSTGQLYTALVPPIDDFWLFMYTSNGSIDEFWLVDGKGVTDESYTEVGWSREGETGGPGTYTYEMKVTPFEFLDFRGPEGSTIVDLEDGNIIHIGYLFKDYDTSEAYEGAYDFPPNHDVWFNAELMGDFVLSPMDETIDWPTAVETDTWGRIKSSLSTK